LEKLIIEAEEKKEDAKEGEEAKHAYADKYRAESV